jgi:hypothetical protein
MTRGSSVAISRSARMLSLDVNASEVDDLAAKGTKQARRGRKPKGNSN